MEYIYCCICEKDNTKVIYNENDVKIVECRNCGLAYHNPRPNSTLLLEEYSTKYFENNEKSDSQAKLQSYRGDYVNRFSQFEVQYRKYLNSILDDIEKVKPSGKILDIGCAAGFLLEVAKKRGWDAFGVEPSAKMSLYGRDKLGIKIFTGTLLDASFESNYFDVINFADVLEHIPQPLQLLNECFRISKRDMILRIQVPNDLYNKSSKAIKSITGQLKPATLPPQHLYFYNKNSLSKILNKTGFSANRYRYRYYFRPEGVEVSINGSGMKGLLKRSLNKILTPKLFTPFWKGIRKGVRFFRILKKESDLIEVIASKK
jgi:SAM-dependent methyltransferase